MNLINKDDIEIDISDSVIFSRLIDFKEGRTTYDETVNLIVKDVEECVKESINKLPVLMGYSEYVLAKQMLSMLAKRLDEAVLNGVSE